MECDGANDSHDGAVNEGSQTGTESLKFKLRSWRTGHRREKLRKKLGEKFGKEKRVLILGGTQFMGRLTTTLLLKDGHHVTLINRGRSPNPFGDAVTTFHCDRHLQRDRLIDFIRSGGYWDAIIDFVGFYPSVMCDTVRALAVQSLESASSPTFPDVFGESAGRWSPNGLGNGTHVRTAVSTSARASGIGETTSWNVGHYVYISSDSTYMACEVGGSPGAVTEAEGKRPAEVEAREILRRSSEYQYEYGSNKLACEEALQQASQQGGFPFTALRLADVVGPFDNIAAHL
ncbi:hypothetical protein CYMTET_7143, partial [Cymbomonas tetramitiformis]